MKVKSVIMKVITGLLLLAVICAAGLAFVPSVLRSVDNARARECREYSKAMLSLLEKKMSEDEENEFWYDRVAEKNSSKLISALDHELGGSDFADNYYIKFKSNSLQLLCREHPRVLDVSMELPDHLVHNEREYAVPASSFPTAIHAEGAGIYYAGVPLGGTHKLSYTDADDTNALFPDITVTASYAGGGERVLASDEYRILFGSLDVSKPSHRTLLIEYGDYPKLLTTFDIDILGNDRYKPLVLCSDSGVKYTLRYWDWMEYFADSLDAPGREYMDFSPSLVHDRGKFYYFPDGLSIIKDSEYNSSIMGARDTQIHDKQAHYVELDTESLMYTAASPPKPKKGAMRVGGENKDEIYVWQDKPSKEFGAGWIQIFNEIEKLD